MAVSWFRSILDISNYCKVGFNMFPYQQAFFMLIILWLHKELKPMLEKYKLYWSISKNMWA